LAVDEWVRRPRRSSGVPGEGPSNAGKGNAHEHQQAMGKRFVYLDGLEAKREKLSTTGSILGGAGEQRLGAKANPAEGSWEPNWVGSRCWRRGWRSN
jgi:hypothetical protein